MLKGYKISFFQLEISISGWLWPSSAYTLILNIEVSSSLGSDAVYSCTARVAVLRTYQGEFELCWSLLGRLCNTERDAWNRVLSAIDFRSR